MKHTLEFFTGSTVAAGAYVISHYNAIVAALVGTSALIVWGFKLRHEWRHRND